MTILPSIALDWRVLCQGGCGAFIFYHRLRQVWNALCDSCRSARGDARLMGASIIQQHIQKERDKQIHITKGDEGCHRDFCVHPAMTASLETLLIKVEKRA